jgi:hypothetical protein
MRARPGALGLTAMTLALTLAGAACGSDDNGSAAPSTTATTVTTTTGGGARQNACPVEGCKITITNVQPAGKELRITWNANFAPDFSKNHIHVYWDRYTADQVSDDAAKRGVKQGEWVPTGDYPEYVTEGPVSTSAAARGDSKSVCVTAGDRNHNVIDSSLVDCRDVSSLLS